MKKILIIIAIIILLISISNEEKIVIPNDTIRFRVIANSYSEEDNEIKKIVVNNLKEEIQKLEINSNSIENTRTIINKEIPSIEKMVEKTLEHTKYVNNYNINYGMNYFPKKEYNGIIYEEGNYESLVITIGDGLGENFWCILFPPLCKINLDTTNIEYKSFIKEILKKYI